MITMQGNGTLDLNNTSSREPNVAIYICENSILNIDGCTLNADNTFSGNTSEYTSNACIRIGNFLAVQDVSELKLSSGTLNVKGRGTSLEISDSFVGLLMVKKRILLMKSL